MDEQNVLVSIHMMEGRITRPFHVLRSLSIMAKALGASSLTIEASVGNARLLDVLVRRYGAETAGGVERITVAIEG